MAGEKYHFVTHWQVEGSREDVFTIIDNAPDLVRWWPSVYLEVRELESGDARGIGKVVALYTKGWLPYTLRWSFRVMEKVFPERIVLEAFGELRGRGQWTFIQDGPWVRVTYDWDIRADKPLLRYLSFLLKPIFAANHRWAMARGEESLRLELARRRARTPEEKARIPEPPPPSTTSSIPLLAGLALAGAVLAGLIYGLVRLGSRFYSPPG